MRGSPLRQFFLTLAGVLLAGIPLYFLTTPTASPRPQSPIIASVHTSPAYITIRCAHAPETITILLDQRVLVEKKSPIALTIEEEITLPIPPSGSVRLKVEATWPEHTPDTPITITLEPEQLESHTETHWSAGTRLNDIYTFSWPS